MKDNMLNFPVGQTSMFEFLPEYKGGGGNGNSM